MRRTAELLVGDVSSYILAQCKLLAGNTEFVLIKTITKICKSVISAKQTRKEICGEVSKVKCL
jgi:hypothetical protein